MAVFLGLCLTWPRVTMGQLDLLNPLQRTDTGKEEGQTWEQWGDRDACLELALREGN